LPRDARRWLRGGIDAAIVSIPLPDEGDEEFVRELHEANPSIPVLVMTDLVEDKEIRPRFLGAGASEIVSKEASLVEVLAAVRRLGGEGQGMGTRL
jgi:DNA-binding NarL/FixJ family response regulator